MKNYDIGILTFWNVPNYGTFAQAYALQKTIANMMPERDVCQIDYLNKRHFRSYYSIIPPRNLRNKKFYIDLLKRLYPFSKHNKKKQQFLNSYATIRHTERMDADTLGRAKFKSVVLGSDIIWDYSFKVFGNDAFLFGNSFNAENICSYAASFGTVKKQDEVPAFAAEGIKKLSHISVRDENSADIVEKLIGERPEIVLDPTWLWDFKSDPNVVPMNYDNYMIIYGQDFTDEFISQIRDYAAKKNYKLICLDCNDDNYGWCDVTIKQYELSPYEWLGLIRDAEAVATSTYHGLTFSLIFNKRFAFCRTDFIMAKASSFLTKLGLYDLFNDPKSTVQSMLDFDWDYDKINSVISKERGKSTEYLKKALL